MQVQFGTVWFRMLGVVLYVDSEFNCRTIKYMTFVIDNQMESVEVELE